MSNKQNEDYIENKYQEFQEGDTNVREAIIEELKINGFVNEAGNLEQQQEEEDARSEPLAQSISDIMDDDIN